MSVEAHCLPIAHTGFFSALVKDYVGGAAGLKDFYVHAPTAEGAAAALQARQNAQPVDRALLVSVLQEQYEGVWQDNDPVKAQVTALLQDNCFTVVTAHQPNVFTGPLYVVYKILHTVALCTQLQALHPDKKFVPVYYMGSEDADLAELGEFRVDGFVRQWNTQQTGAVGRMVVDPAFQQLLAALKGQLNVLPHGPALMTIFEKAYAPGRTMQNAMLHLVHALFGRWGLVVLVPDHPRLKAAFVPVLEKELFEQFSAPLVSATLSDFPPQYKVQTKGRELNLFYLRDNKRERILPTKDGFAVAQTDWVFTPAAMRQELAQHPERFSPNVILRGLFQETILPNIAFVGGGGELAYWLELKRVFEATGTPFPQLVLRNSYLCIDPSQWAKWRALGLDKTDLFLPDQERLEKWLSAQGAKPPSLLAEKEKLQQFYATLEAKAGAVDASLVPHVRALAAQALGKIDALEKKIFRAEKRKHAQGLQQLHHLLDQFFPQGSLQERTENFAGFYARWGAQWLDQVLSAALTWEQSFTLLFLPPAP